MDSKIDMDILADQLERHEGRRPLPYKDSVGVLTVGVGRNLERPLSEDEIDLMLSNDIKAAAKDAEKFLWFSGLDGIRQQVVVNMLFNLGWKRFTGFRKMIAAIEDRDWERAAVEMKDSKWYTQVGYRAEELIHMMRTGIQNYRYRYKTGGGF